ncbi:HNH endonuclease signature motif containing protein [uncultured Cellulomonas sp.]|uniref:HNH endonuclease signature motif containing protein n=1 Tax=uncultured Cellulomonas sp. TaxID=189682 RepID=UPI0028EBC6B7|nr:HNH endonuclease signature motif containing protein [uncultured Cellulomonas sp.]
MAAGDDRGHGGNSGYDDQVDAYYSWDSNVPNHKNLGVGDAVAVWNKQRLLGVSVIEEIEASHGPKLLKRCPSCGTTRISSRKTASPRYRCMKCHHKFEMPRSDVVDVMQYRARYDAAWTSLDGTLDQTEIRSLAVNAGEFNAMRPLDWGAFCDALLTKGAGHAVGRVSARLDLSWPLGTSPIVELPQGFGQALVRVRRGQQQFRDHLLATQGSTCAFTGGAPTRVLEAGHLYSYAQLGTHFEHGGLMLRRDIHRLFDDGLLAVQPSTLRIDVAPSLARYPQYARLHDETLTLSLKDPQIDWLSKHWDEHRSLRSIM